MQGSIFSACPESRGPTSSAKKKEEKGESMPSLPIPPTILIEPYRYGIMISTTTLVLVLAQVLSAVAGKPNTFQVVGKTGVSAQQMFLGVSPRSLAIGGVS